jgi:hypothetical protein
VKMEAVLLRGPDLPQKRRRLLSCPRPVGSMQGTASWRIRSGRTWLDRNLRHRCPITVVSARRGPGRLPGKETTASVWPMSVDVRLAVWTAISSNITRLLSMQGSPGSHAPDAVDSL